MWLSGLVLTKLQVWLVGVRFRVEGVVLLVVFLDVKCICTRGMTINLSVM